MLNVFSKLSKRERMIIYFLLVAFGAFLFDKTVLQPVAGRLSALNQEIGEKEKKLIRALHVLQQEEHIIDEHDKHTARLMQEASDEETITAFQSSVEQIAKKTNLNIMNMQPMNVNISEDYKKYSVRVEAEATMVYLADFIFQLERDPQLLRISEINLSPGRRAASFIRINMLITKITLMRQEEEEEEEE